MKKRLILFFAAVVIIAVGIFGGIKVKNYLPFFFDKNGIKQPDTEYTLVIEKSDFENEVAAKLQEEGIIISSVRFLGYLKEKYPSFVWYNGKYKLTADMSYKELCEKLSDPDERLEYIKFTVPEGKNIRGIAEIVENAGACTAKEFLIAADSYDYDFDFIDELKKRNQDIIAYKLEGYLFPATYEFRADTVTAKEVVTEMLRAFSNYVTDDIITKANEKGLSVNELITFASVIQAEAFSVESMANISSVFWNRLNSAELRQLQSDPTTTYAKALKDLNNYSDAMYNAYDTYSCIGLPIAPTNSPGLDVIDAVLNPSDTDYYYFVTDDEGNFYYNKTYNEHVKTCYAIGLWK